MTNSYMGSHPRMHQLQQTAKPLLNINNLMLRDIRSLTSIAQHHNTMLPYRGALNLAIDFSFNNKY